MNSFIKNTILLLLLMATLWPSLKLEAAEPSQKPIEATQELEEYIIGAEDVIEVSVWRNDALSKVVAVRPDGKISLPLIGDIQAGGLTPSQLRDEIVKRLKVYQESPTVSVIIQQINSLNIYVIGEVSRPGQYRLKSNTTLLQLLSMAGGFTQFASKNNIIILRNNPLAKEKRLIIRYDDIVFSGDEKGNIMLRPGDTIIIP